MNGKQELDRSFGKWCKEHYQVLLDWELSPERARELHDAWYVAGMRRVGLGAGEHAVELMAEAERIWEGNHGTE